MSLLRGCRVSKALHRSHGKQRGHQTPTSWGIFPEGMERLEASYNVKNLYSWGSCWELRPEGWHIPVLATNTWTREPTGGPQNCQAEEEGLLVRYWLVRGTADQPRLSVDLKEILVNHRMTVKVSFVCSFLAESPFIDGRATSDILVSTHCIMFIYSNRQQ